MNMSNVDTTALRELLSKWQAETAEDLAPTASLIWVGERLGIQRCAMQLEKVIEEIEADNDPRLDDLDKMRMEQHRDRIEMDPYNTSADRPQ
jgi:hypothetical protein